MKQIYHKYTDWEDYKNGMFSNGVDKELIRKGVNLLRNDNLFLETSMLVLNYWIISCDVNLSNSNSNRQSWIGQAACSYLYGINESTTRFVWKELTLKEKIKANLIADKIIKLYEAKYYKLHSEMGTEMLF